MCLTMPARVIAVDGAWAEIEVDGIRRRASTLPVPEVKPGDWALVAAGTLVRLLDPELAQEIADAAQVARHGSEPSVTAGGTMNRSLQSIDAALSASRLKTGLALACATALVSGISVFVNASAVRAFDDPVLFTTLKNGVAAVAPRGDGAGRRAWPMGAAAQGQCPGSWRSASSVAASPSSSSSPAWPRRRLRRRQ